MRGCLGVTVAVAGLLATPAAASAAAAGVVAQQAPAHHGSVGFSYSAILLVPLALLALVLFLYNAFTRPIRPRRRPGGRDT